MTIWHCLARHSHFDTQRLLLRPLSLADSEALYRIVTTSVSMERVVPAFTSQEACEQFLVEEFLRQPLGVWAVVEKATTTVVGVLRLEKIREGIGQADLVYFLDQVYRGKGLMTEAVSALCSLLVEQGSFNCLCIVSHEENLASQRVAERSGFVLFRQYKGSDRQSRQMKAYREYRYTARQ